MSDWESDPKSSDEDNLAVSNTASSFNNMRLNNGNSRQNSRFSGARGRARPSSRPASRPDSIVSIAGRDRGRLIGRGGESIRRLEDESGARIKIGEENTQSGVRDAVDVLLFGNDHQCKEAGRLIDEHLGYNSGDVDNNQEKKTNEGQLYADDDYNVDWDAIRRMHAEQERTRWAKCPSLRKEFYEEHPEVAAMTQEQVDAFRLENQNLEISMFQKEDEPRLDEIKVEKEQLLKPCPEFKHAFHNFPDALETISRQKFEKPSPIQSQMWPYLLSGKDVIGIAQTGTGKTLAFLLPAFIHIVGQPVPRGERGGPNVLVLSPTRELALQIADEVKKYEYQGIKSVVVYGGGDRKKQMKVVTEGVEIIIATPGRLNDLIGAECINVESVTYLVLDEADRMLDMGFEPQIRKVLLDIRPDRQTVMTSATWPSGVRRMASNYMTDPVTVFVGSLDLQAVQCVTQTLRFLDTDEEKRPALMEFIYAMRKEDKAIIFVGRKARANDLSSDLSIKNIPCQSIHGDREQSDREEALQDLRSGEVNILVATDVASRGLDIVDITHVINYDFPRNIEEYVHRVGRTGRAGRSGEAITFMSRDDWKHSKDLIKILEQAQQEVPQELIDMANRFDKFLQRKAAERDGMAGGMGRGRGRGGGGDRDFFGRGSEGNFARYNNQGQGNGGGRFY